jgi:hypothetical protein
MDTAGHFYFTTLREYDRIHASLFTGDFDGHVVRNVHRLPGDIGSGFFGVVNMDADISPDGQTLYISRATIVPGASVPRRSELVMATIAKGVFNLDVRSTIFLININTGPLEYAPCISANGLELYFTRASRRSDPAGALQSSVRIMVATRALTTDSFGKPQVLANLRGFVEAPSLSLDEKELFFHRKVGDRFTIYRAERAH